MPRLSIVVTSFNVENYIEQCLDTILAQSFSDYELIIVDDASTDKTVEIAEKKCAGLANCRVIRLGENTPGGAGPPSNVGIEASNGDYIGFVDGDDYADPAMFKELITVADRDNADVVMCQHMNFSDEGTTQFIKPADSNRWTDLLASQSSGNSQKYKLDTLNMISVPWRKIYRREFINSYRIRFPEGNFFYEDNPFHWFVTFHTNRLSLVPKELIFHRVSRAGQTMSVRDERVLKMFVHFDTIREFLNKEGAPQAYHVQLCRWAISQMEWISQQLDPPHRQQLYDDFARCLNSYQITVVRKAVRKQKIGLRGAALTWFALTRRNRRFLEHLDGWKQLSGSELFHILYLRSGALGPIQHHLDAAWNNTVKLPSKISSLLPLPSPLGESALRSEIRTLRQDVKTLQHLVIAAHLNGSNEDQKRSETEAILDDPARPMNRYAPKSVVEQNSKRN